VRRTLFIIVPVVLTVVGAWLGYRHEAKSNDPDLSSLRSILEAQGKFAADYPKVGYACDLQRLGGEGGNEFHAGLIDPTLATGSKSGYRYAIITPCEQKDGVNIGFRVLAVAESSPETLPVFCADQTGALRRHHGTALECFTKGTPVEEPKH
jgi:hypothetical protein